MFAQRLLYRIIAASVREPDAPWRALRAGLPLLLVITSSCVQKPPPPGEADAGAEVDAHVVPPSPDTGPPPPPPPPMLDAGACMPVQLLANAAFDDAPRGANWLQASSSGSEVVIDADPSSVTAHTAPNKVLLGGEDFVLEELSQEGIRVPAGARTVTLAGQYRVVTREVEAVAFDEAWVALESGSVTEELHRWDNRSASTGWTSFSRTATIPVAGRDVALRFRAITDDLQATSFFIDSLTLTASVCP